MQTRLGGPEETRTLDLSDANRTLSQLSYRPKFERHWKNANTYYSIRFGFVKRLQKKTISALAKWGGI